MKKRLETKLFSNGAEFLVMSKLLLSNIETYKAYVDLFELTGVEYEVYGDSLVIKEQK